MNPVNDQINVHLSIYISLYLKRHSTPYLQPAKASSHARFLNSVCMSVYLYKAFSHARFLNFVCLLVSQSIYLSIYLKRHSTPYLYPAKASSHARFLNSVYILLLKFSRRKKDQNLQKKKYNTSRQQITWEISKDEVKIQIMVIKQSSGFHGIFTVDFLLFIALAGGGGESLTLPGIH